MKTELAAQNLDLGVDAFFEVDYEKAIGYATDSIGQEASEEAYGFKSQMQYLTRDFDGAFATLEEYRSRFPASGADDLLRAYLLCLRGSTDGDLILGNLRTALEDGFGGLDHETFWLMVEEFDGFSRFRDAFPVQYASLQALKTAAPDVAPGAGGVSKFVKNNGVGPAFFIKHEHMWMIRVFRDLEALIASVVIPKPYNYLVSQAIKVRTSFINARNRNQRGVRLQWTYISWVPSLVFIELFLTYPQ